MAEHSDGLSRHYGLSPRTSNIMAVQIAAEDSALLCFVFFCAEVLRRSVRHYKNYVKDLRTHRFRDLRLSYWCCWKFKFSAICTLLSETPAWEPQISNRCFFKWEVEHSYGLYKANNDSGEAFVCFTLFDWRQRVSRNVRKYFPNNIPKELNI